jgi:hypothetical protein
MVEVLHEDDEYKVDIDVTPGTRNATRRRLTLSSSCATW